MEVKNFIKIYDRILPLNVLGNLIRYANQSKFIETLVGGGTEAVVDFSVRKTYTLPLSNLDKSFTVTHWYNLLQYHFNLCLREYKKDNNIIDFDLDKVTNIEILKYENTGFYNWHTDHFSVHPRTMSCILLLNNDYEGGNLCFRNPDGSGEWDVEVKANRMIVWPSNFLYPHTVKPVTKGTRYSVVAWAL
jgi:hypothetical protein